MHLGRVFDLLVCEDLPQRLADEGRVAAVRDTDAVVREHKGVEILFRVQHEARWRKSTGRGALHAGGQQAPPQLGEQPPQGKHEQSKAQAGSERAREEPLAEAAELGAQRAGCRRRHRCACWVLARRCAPGFGEGAAPPSPSVAKASPSAAERRAPLRSRWGHLKTSAVARRPDVLDPLLLRRLRVNV
eukprot:scaffold39653_cov60-Phaeocystis_antarctica.AAC.1